MGQILHGSATTTEAVRRAMLPSAGRVRYSLKGTITAMRALEPDVSHFAFLQDPDMFTRDVEHFLAKR